MTDQDKKLATVAFTGGPSALLEEGMTVAEVKAFIGRPEIHQYMQALDAELPIHQSLMDRQKFVAKRALARLAPQAVQLLADAMRGIEYEKDADGNIVMEVTTKGKGRTAEEIKRPKIKHIPPADYQVEAAQDVLDRIGVNEKSAVDAGTSVSVKLMFDDAQKSGVEIPYASTHMTEKQKVASRERLRTVMEKLYGKMTAVQQEMKALIAPSTSGKAAKAAVLKAKSKAKAKHGK